MTDFRVFVYRRLRLPKTSCRRQELKDRLAAKERLDSTEPIRPSRNRQLERNTVA
jgi:hypothetical protein